MITLTFLLIGFVAAASGAPVAQQDVFLISPQAPQRISFTVPQTSSPVVPSLKEFLEAFIPLEHRLEPTIPQLKPVDDGVAYYLPSGIALQNFIPAAAQKPDRDVIGSTPAGSADVTQATSESPIVVSLSLAFPATAKGNKLKITIDLEPSGGSATESVSTSSNPDGNSAITVEAAPLINLLTHPDTLATPVVGSAGTDEDDLSDRNPGAAGPVAPAGIVQSGAPTFVEKPFENSKDSPVLVELVADALAQFGSLKNN